MQAQREASNFPSERFNSFHNFMAPSSLLFALTLITGTFIAVSSTNWLYLWIGIELNLLSFIPLIAASQSLQETEASVKYFIIQAIGRGLMLTAGIISMNPIVAKSFHILIPTIFFVSMIIKLGMAPCHQWLPHVMSRISWTHCIILATWQKVSPLIIIIFFIPREFYYLIIATAILRALVGGLGGINQTQLRTLLAYSSIGHIGWMLSTIECSFTLFSTYFIIYIIISIRLITLLASNNIIISKIPNSVISITTLSFLIIILIIFSLGGLPPFLGFLPKWLIISELAFQHIFLLIIVLITGSLINLFYYFNITFNFILTSSQQPGPYASLPWAPILTARCTISSFILIM